jgi:type VI protein secretion system component VasF
MISEREQQLLEALERQTRHEDPEFARRLGNDDGWARWRAAGRRAVTWPVLLLVAALAVVAFVLHVSAVGLLLLVWLAAAGVARRWFRGDLRG